MSPSLQYDALTWNSGLGTAVSDQMLRIGAITDHGEGGDPQPRCADGNEGHVLDGLVGLHGAVLKGGDETEAVELPFRESAWPSPSICWALRRR